MTDMAAGNVTYSKNGKLYAGMTQEMMQSKCEGESKRAAKKLAKAFEMADGLGEGGIKDGVISEQEIEAYDKEMKKKNWRTGLMVAGGVLTSALIAFAAYKGINKMNSIKQSKLSLQKALEDVNKLNETINYHEQQLVTLNERMTNLQHEFHHYNDIKPQLFKSGVPSSTENTAETAKEILAKVSNFDCMS